MALAMVRRHVQSLAGTSMEKLGLAGGVVDHIRALLPVHYSRLRLREGIMPSSVTTVSAFTYHQCRHFQRHLSYVAAVRQSRLRSFNALLPLLNYSLLTRLWVVAASCSAYMRPVLCLVRKSTLPCYKITFCSSLPQCQPSPPSPRMFCRLPTQLPVALRKEMVHMLSMDLPVALLLILRFIIPRLRISVLLKLLSLAPVTREFIAEFGYLSESRMLSWSSMRRMLGLEELGMRIDTRDVHAIFLVSSILFGSHSWTSRVAMLCGTFCGERLSRKLCKVPSGLPENYKTPFIEAPFKNL